MTTDSLELGSSKGQGLVSVTPHSPECPLGLGSVATEMCWEGVSGTSETSRLLTVAYTLHASFSLPCLQPFQHQEAPWGSGSGRSQGGGGQVGVKSE